MDFHGIKRQCAHWHLFHGSIDTGFPCEKNNQRKQQRSSCLRRHQSMGREGGEKIQLYKHGGNVLKSGDETNAGEPFPRYSFMQL